MLNRIRTLSIYFILCVACGAATAGSGAMVACRPGPPSAVHGSVVPTGDWQSRARLALSTLSQAVPAAALVVSLWPMDDADRQAMLSDLSAVRDEYLPSLRRALASDAGTSCAGDAALVAIAERLKSFALRAASALHWDIPDAISMGLGLASAVADELTSECSADAGWSSLSSSTRLALGGRRGHLRPFPSEEEAREEADR